MPVKIEKGVYLAMQTLLTRRLVSLLMGSMLLIGLLVSQSGVVSAHSTLVQSSGRAAQQTDSGSCNSQAGPHICIAPNSTTGYDNICGGIQWYGGTSHDGHPIGYTYTYGTQHCLTVTWDLSGISNLQNCNALIYIPAGDATATVQYTTNGGKDGSILDQSAWGANGTGEFIQIFGQNQLGTSIQLTDQTISSQGTIGNDQTWHKAIIGWGTDPQYSLDINCP